MGLTSIHRQIPSTPQSINPSHRLLESWNRWRIGFDYRTASGSGFRTCVGVRAMLRARTRRYKNGLPLKDAHRSRSILAHDHLERTTVFGASASLMAPTSFYIMNDKSFEATVSVCISGLLRTFLEPHVQESFATQLHWPGYAYFLSSDE